jgi:hypothetical protein
MKKHTEEIDLLIKETLSKEENIYYNSLREQNLYDMVIGQFTGKNAWLLIIINIMIIAFLGLFVYCLIQFLNSDTQDVSIKWGIGSIICILSVSVLKIYAWMQMDKNAILRQMKKLEIQLMSLSRKMTE